MRLAFWWVCFFDDVSISFCNQRKVRSLSHVQAKHTAHFSFFFFGEKRIENALDLPTSTKLVDYSYSIWTISTTAYSMRAWGVRMSQYFLHNQRLSTVCSLVLAAILIAEIWTRKIKCNFIFANKPQILFPHFFVSGFPNQVRDEGEKWERNKWNNLDLKMF